MNIALTNRQQVETPCLPAIRRLAHFLHSCACVASGEMTGIRRTGRVNIVLADNRLIRTLKSTYFGRDEITDVIAINFLNTDCIPEQIDGEIFVNVELAVARGRSAAAHELALYIAHGLDHLAGADDAIPAERRRMRRRELLWLQKASAARLLANLFKRRIKLRRPRSSQPLRHHA